MQAKSVPVQDVVALRADCTYWLFREEPTSGRWWAIRKVSCEFPGDFEPKTSDGEPVEQFCVVVCERRSDNNLWQWCYLSMQAKKVFGDLLFDNNCGEEWYYVVEEDLAIRK